MLTRPSFLTLQLLCLLAVTQVAQASRAYRPHSTNIALAQAHRVSRSLYAATERTGDHDLVQVEVSLHHGAPPSLVAPEKSSSLPTDHSPEPNGDSTFPCPCHDSNERSSLLKVAITGKHDEIKEFDTRTLRRSPSPLPDIGSNTSADVSSPVDAASARSLTDSTPATPEAPSVPLRFRRAPVDLLSNVHLVQQSASKRQIHNADYKSSPSPSSSASSPSSTDKPASSSEAGASPAKEDKKSEADSHNASTDGTEKNKRVQERSSWTGRRLPRSAAMRRLPSSASRSESEPEPKKDENSKEGSTEDANGDGDGGDSLPDDETDTEPLSLKVRTRDSALRSFSSRVSRFARRARS